jgi:hypothetical protein
LQSNYRLLRNPLTLVLAILFAAPVGRAQNHFHFQSSCTKWDYPVLVYDGQLRRMHIVERKLVANPTLGRTIAGEPFEFVGYLCDGRPVEMYIVNRKLKEVFNPTITGVVSVPSAVVSIRGVTPGVAPPAAAPAAAAPAAKGGVTTTPLQVATVIDLWLSAETFNQPEQTIKEEAEQLRALARQQNAQIHQYLDKLNHLIEVPPGSPDGPSPRDTQGSATLVGTTRAFEEMTAQIGRELTSADVPDIEPRFDRLNVRIGVLIQDVQRLNTNVQSFPIVDQLNALQLQEETFETGVRQYRKDIETAQLAAKILNDLLGRINNKQGTLEYLKERVSAEIRRELLSLFPSATPNMDAATIASIAKSYESSAKEYINNTLPNCLGALTVRLADYEANRVPEAYLLETGAMRARFNAAAARLPRLREAIDVLNRTEAAAFDAINSRYRDFRIPSAIPAYLNLSGYSGNLSVFYSLTGVETFQPYVMANETPEPSPASLQAAPSPPAAAAAPAVASATVSPAAAAPAAGTAAAQAPAAAVPAAAAAASAGTASAAAPATPPSPIPEYFGNFQVHHFDHGTIFGGFAFSSLSNLSYSVTTAPCPPTVCPSASFSSYAGQTAYVISQTSSMRGKAVVVGVELYLRPQDMYPDVRDKWMSPGVLLGASVYPLNQYYFGLAIEPKHGITIGAGFAVGSEQRLPPSNYVGQYLGPTQILTPSGTLAPVSAPTLNTDTAFRKSGFIMIGFDINIFQAIFSQVANVGTPSAPGSSTSR